MTRRREAGRTMSFPSAGRPSRTKIMQCGTCCSPGSRSAGSRVVWPFLDGIDLLAVASRRSGRRGLNAILEPRTGWRTVAVPGLVPDDMFFAMLAERIFPVGNFIRTREQLDYLEAPDCFHDMFGHIPMLAHHDFAEWPSISAGSGGRPAQPVKASALRGFTGTRRVRARARAWRAQDPRRGPRLELWRGALQFRQRGGRAPALLDRASGAHALQT